MRKILLATQFIFFSMYCAFSQCPGAVLDSSCLGTLLTTGGGICLSVLPPATSGSYYSEDVSFVMPKRIRVTSPITLDVDLENIQVTGMSGLPTGISWSCDAFSSRPCEYNPQSGENLGAVKFCGTPLVPGTYNITVYIHARVNAGTFGRVEQDETYRTVLEVLPDTTGGVSTFSIKPGNKSACDSGTYQFAALYKSNTNYVKYEWDFGNGTRSNDTVPLPQTYSIPGTYKVSLRTIVYNWRVTDFNIVTTDGGRWSGDIEELTTLSIPDFYWKIPSIGYTSPTRSENRTPFWSGLSINIPAGTSSIRYQIWEDDGGPPFGSADDFVAEGDIPCRLGSWAYTDMGSSGFIKFDTVRGEVFFDTVLITVTPKPVISALYYDKDSICSGDSSTLFVNAQSGKSYQWYKDSSVVPLANDTLYVVYNSGLYSIRVTDDASGCFAVSDSIPVYNFTSPPPSLALITPAPGLIANSNFPGAGFGIEWFFNGIKVPGSADPVLNHFGDGAYTARVYNLLNPNCDVVSDVLLISGIISNASYEVLVYPNPSSGVFFIDSEMLKEQTRIQCFNAQGSLVKSIDAQGGENKISLDLENMPKGLYHLQLTNALFYKSLTLFLH